MTKLLLFLLLFSSLPGCMTSGKLAKTVQALGKDPATVRLRITSIYGVIELSRVNAGANTPAHEIAPDGKITVKSAP